MNKKQKEDSPVTGVFIFSKDIKNDGRIISSGERPVTHIQTDQYSGKGSIESHQYGTGDKKWYEKWWIKYLLLPLVVLVIGAFIIFKFGWS